MNQSKIITKKDVKKTLNGPNSNCFRSEGEVWAKLRCLQNTRFYYVPIRNYHYKDVKKTLNGPDSEFLTNISFGMGHSSSN